MKSKPIAVMLGGLIFGAVAGQLVSGCASTDSKPASDAKAATKPSAGLVAGAQLWAQNCGHCHNLRSPSSYSDAQWDVAVLHMRIRANLTAEEHKEILAFLKSAH